jgi:hypothetical protein
MRLAPLCVPIATTLLLSSLLQPAAAQQMSKEDQAIYDQMVRNAGIDPKLMQQAQQQNDNARRWTSGRGGLVHYHIVGTYKGTPNVLGGSNWIGLADVTDRVEIDLDWKLDESKLVGTPSFHNFKSAVGPVRSPERKCSPPTISGPYEHFELTAIKQGLSGQLDLHSTTSHPPGKAIQNCTGSPIAVPASVVRDVTDFVVASPVLFDTAASSNGKVRVSADRKSLITRDGGWTWTYTPSVKK